MFISNEHIIMHINPRQHRTVHTTAKMFSSTENSIKKHEAALNPRDNNSTAVLALVKLCADPGISGDCHNSENCFHK